KLFELNKENALKIEERNSIAQKLHDELGHTLSGSTMQIEAALMLLDKDEDKSKHMLRTVIRNLREGTDSTRRILRNIKPETASMNIQTIKLLVFETQEKSGISIDLIYDHDIVFLDHTMWYVITINVKEALTNLMKYSQATKCAIKFESLNQRYKVSINDNGIGCQNIKQGMGLSGMEERIHQVGGQLIVDGSDGFSIIMLLPLEKGM
ncbi:MAG: histidine kinase, partial [Clostridia bacterium]|nr:histidine kinase [Clostridia bacterium]